MATLVTLYVEESGSGDVRRLVEQAEIVGTSVFSSADRALERSARLARRRRRS